MMNKAVFLDRDGTINIDKGYVYKIEDFEFIKGVPNAIKMLNDNGYKVIVITNQSGVARGFYSEEAVIKLHRYINNLLKGYDAHIDGFYYCPHHVEYGLGKYKIDCNCRKPKPGLLDKAILDFNIDESKSWMIGDNISDILAGKAANIRSILLDDEENGCDKFISLENAVKYIINKVAGD